MLPLLFLVLVYLVGISEGQCTFGCPKPGGGPQYLPPLAGSWTVANTPQNFFAHGAAVTYHNHIYVIGGYGLVANVPTSTSEIWIRNYTTSQWTKSGATLITPRSYMSASVANNAIYVFGGYDDQRNVLSSVERLGGAAMNYPWTFDTAMPFPLYYHASTTGSTGKIYVTGGTTANSTGSYNLGSLWIFTPGTAGTSGTWDTTGEMFPNGRLLTSHGSTSSPDMTGIYVVGGSLFSSIGGGTDLSASVLGGKGISGALGVNQNWDFSYPGIGAFTRNSGGVPPNPKGVAFPGATTSGNLVWAIGGTDNGQLFFGQAAAYNATLLNWADGPALHNNRSAPATTTACDGTIWVFGGQKDTSFGIQASAEYYKPPQAVDTCSATFPVDPPPPTPISSSSTGFSSSSSIVGSSTSFCPGDASAPANGNAGACASTVLAGKSCYMACNNGYVATPNQLAFGRACGASGGTLGAINPAATCTRQCQGDPNVFPVNGNAGNCTLNALTPNKCSTACATLTPDVPGSVLSSGDLSRTCQSTGLWSPLNAVCTVQCPPNSTAPIHGTAGTCGTLTANQTGTCLSTCNSGFTPSGSLTRVCQATGFYDPAPMCLATCLGDATSPDGGTAGNCTNNALEGATCVQTCNAGYQLVAGSLTRTCAFASGSSGAWSGSNAACDQTCVAATDYPANGNIGDCNIPAAPGSTCQMGCNQGYVWNGQGSLTRGCYGGGQYEAIQQGTACVTGTASSSPTTSSGTTSSGTTSSGAKSSGTTSSGTTSSGTTSSGTTSSGTKSSGTTSSGTTSSGTTSSGTTSSGTTSSGGGTTSSGTSTVSSTAGSGSSSTAVFCNADSVTAPTNGNAGTCATANGVSPNGVCTTACNSGFSSSGSLQRTCGPSGSWSSITGTCTASAITCAPSALYPTNGGAGDCVTVNAAPLGSTCTLTCASGYGLSAGSLTRTCVTPGSWTAVSATCTAQCAADASGPTSGNAGTCNAVAFAGATCNLQCNSGFTLNSGSLLRTCGSNGQWSTIVAECTAGAASCPADSTGPSNGVAGTCNQQSSVGNTCAQQCNAGYTLTQGSLTRTCQSGGTWSATNAVCTRTCSSDSNTPVNGNAGTCATIGTVAVGTTCSVQCSSGFGLTGGSVTRTCQQDGTWTQITATCTASSIVCNGDSSAPTNGAAGTCTSTSSLGNTCDQQCNTGYKLGSGSLTRTCQQSGQSGQWSTSTASCVPNCAGDSTTLPNGNAGDCTNAAVTGATCNLACNSGFGLTSGSLQRSCQANGQWTPIAATCAVSSTVCQADTTTVPTNGGVGTCNQAGTVGSQCLLTCNNGFLPSPASALKRICQNFGQWTNFNGQCLIACSDATSPTNGNAGNCGTPIVQGATCSTQCNGAVGSGSLTRTCQASGQLTAIATCSAAVTCQDATSAPANGNPGDCGSTVQQGQTCTVACSSGFFGKTGTGTRVCGSDGQFSAWTLVCAAQSGASGLVVSQLLLLGLMLASVITLMA